MHTNLRRTAWRSLVFGALVAATGACVGGPDEEEANEGHRRAIERVAPQEAPAVEEVEVVGSPQADTGTFSGRQMDPFNPEVIWIWHPIENDPREVIITHRQVSNPPPDSVPPNIYVEPPLAGSEFLYLEWIPDPVHPDQNLTFGDGDPSKPENQQKFLEWAMTRTSDDDPLESDFDVQLYADGQEFLVESAAQARTMRTAAEPRGIIASGYTIMVREALRGSHPAKAVAWIWRPKDSPNHEVWLHLLDNQGNYKGKYEKPSKRYSFAVLEFTKLADADPKWKADADGIAAFKKHVMDTKNPKNPKVKAAKDLEVHDYRVKSWK